MWKQWVKRKVTRLIRAWVGEEPKWALKFDWGTIRHNSRVCPLGLTSLGNPTLGCGAVLCLACLVVAPQSGRGTLYAHCPCHLSMAWDICNFLVFTESGSKGPAVNSVEFLLCVQCTLSFIVYFLSSFMCQMCQTCQVCLVLLQHPSGTNSNYSAQDWCYE